YFVTYVRIASGKAPAGIALMFEEQKDVNTFCTGGGPCWTQAYWGAVDGNDPGGGPLNLNSNMGPLPALRDQWIRLVVSATDAGMQTGNQKWAPGWRSIGYKVAGGEAEWDVTTTIDSVGITLTGLPSNLRATLY